MVTTSSKYLKNIYVLSGFHYKKYKDFVQATIDLGHVVCERKLYLIYERDDRGLSKLILKAAFY